MSKVSQCPVCGGLYTINEPHACSVAQDAEMLAFALKEIAVMCEKSNTLVHAKQLARHTLALTGGTENG